MDDPVAQINQILGGSQAQQSSNDPDIQAVNSILGGSSNDSGTSPTVANAESKIGDQADNGLCQKFVEEATYGKSGIFPSAIDAWDSYSQNGQAYQGDVEKAPSGSLIYFAPDSSNGDAGHVGISDGKGNMVSATYNGVQATPISEWLKSTGQTPLGFVKP